MKKIAFLFLAIFFSLNSFGQTCQKEEIQITYSNGLIVCNICKTNPVITFDENKQYYWYTEFSNVKSTLGGCGGNLLHGNFKFYDEYGNLREDKNYFLGIEDGNEMRWDSLGNIIEKTIYNKGEILYFKYLTEDNYWIEYNGRILSEGSIRKLFTMNGILIEEKVILSGLKEHVKLYYEYPANQIKEEFTMAALGTDYMSGSYKSYYNNGKIQVEGSYYEGDYLKIRDGLWRWYNKDGTIDEEETYKAEVLFWPNGEMKVSGGYFFNKVVNEWQKTGEWRWYDEDGKFMEKKEYIYGVEVISE